MLESSSQPNYSGPTTTAESAVSGRLKVGVGQNKKKKAIIKKILKQ